MSSNNALPTTQNAWIIVNRGKPRDALEFKTDVPVPKPKRDEVLVKVRAVALNPMCVSLGSLSSSCTPSSSYKVFRCPTGFFWALAEGGKSWALCQTYCQSDRILQNMTLQV